MDKRSSLFAGRKVLKDGHRVIEPGRDDPQERVSNDVVQTLKNVSERIFTKKIMKII
jgi:hypothetical protein